MPAGAAAMEAYLKEQEENKQNKRKSRSIDDPRRTSLDTCDFSTDVNKSRKAPFPSGICCKRYNCITRFTPQNVLVLRQSLIDRPRNSVNRRVFLTNRYRPIGPGGTRGSGSYLCDSPEVCRVYADATLHSALPLRVLTTIEECASFFCSLS